MKKGLLSILAGALLVVGCQNYDDQFDSLETQINALASTVAGLSQVQSDLASLAGTVGSLSTTVNSLGSTIDTAVADGLADIQADIDAITTAVADVASSEEVAALQTAVDASQTDLTELLAASSVFTGDVNVNSAATLDAFHAMKASLAIVNGNVNITVSTAMDQTKVQELVDSMLTIVKDLTYTSAASSIAETTFDNLTGVQSITITQGGGIRFPNLISATTIDMKDDFESTVDVIHFGSLTTITAFETDGTANLIQFNKASELHLTSLAYYPGGSLTIETDEGAAMPFALDDIDADGDTLDDGLTLNITGPASFSISNIADGSITLTDVKTVSLTDYKGAVTLAGDVESFTSNSLVSLTVSGSVSLETVDVTGAVDPDATTAATKLGPAISLDTLGDLETVTIAGIASSVNIGSNGNLTAVTISADVAGAITIDNNTDLTAITLTGAKAASLDVDTNSDLAALTVDLTWRASGTGTTVDGDLDVTDNESLESLTVSSDNLENLEVTGNDDLTTLDFTGVTKIGATGTAVVNIYDNDLTASKLTDSSDGTTDVANGKSGDLGSVTSSSGMSTLKTYLTAVAADADSAAAVYFDTVESFTSEASVESTDILYSSNTAQNAGTVLLLVANTADTGDAAIATKRSYLIPNTITSLGIVANGVSIIGSAAPSVTNSATLATGNADTIAALINTTSLARADVAGVSISAVGNASPVAYIDIGLNDSTAENSATAVSTTGFVFNASDTFTVSIDGYSATVTGTAYASAAGANADKLTNAVIDVWRSRYVGTGSTVASDAAVRWTLSSETSHGSGLTDAAFGAVRLVFTAKDKGTGSIDAAVAATFTPGKTATYSNVGYVIGNANNNTISTGDNKAQGTAVVLTVTADTAGSLLGQIGVPLKASALTPNNLKVSYAGSGTVSELNSTYNPNITASNVTTATNLYPEESRRNDVVIGAEANSAVTSNAVSFSRVAWL
jgi:hypothetical protein